MKHRDFDHFKKLMEEFEATSVWPKDLGNADHADSAESTLIEVDIKLKEHGLEIVQYDTKADFVAWKIVKRDVICSSCGHDTTGLGGWHVECPDCSEGPYWS